MADPAGVAEPNPLSPAPAAPVADAVAPISPSWTAPVTSPPNEPPPLESSAGGSGVTIPVKVSASKPTVEPLTSPSKPAAATPIASSESSAIPASPGQGEPTAPVPAEKESPPVIPQVSASAPTQVTAPPELVPAAPPPPARPLPWRIITVMVGSLALLGAIVYALWWFGIGLGAPRNPQTALAKMAAALGAHPAYHAEGSLVVGVTVGDELERVVPTEVRVPLADFFVWAAAAVRAAASEIPAFPPAPQTYGLTLRFKTDRASDTAGQATVGLDLAGLGDLLPVTFPSTAELDIRRLGDEIYLRWPLLSLLVGSPSNKWLLLDARDLTGLTEEQSIQNVNLSKIASLLVNARRVGFERIGPKRTAHYRGELFLIEVVKLLGLENQLSAGDLAGASPLLVEWWLGVSDHLPYQVKIAGDATVGETAASLNLTTTYSRYDQPATITAPDPNEVITDGLEGLWGADLSMAQVKARDAQRKSDLFSLKSALGLYRVDHGSYPNTKGETARTETPGNALEILVQQGYIQKLPDDPLSDTYWYGYQSADGTSYELWSVLEDELDPGGVARGDYYLYIITSGEVS